MCQRQPEELLVVDVQQGGLAGIAGIAGRRLGTDGLGDGVDLGDPHPVWEQHSFGAPGGPGGVDQGGEIVGPGTVGACGDGTGVPVEVVAPAVPQLVGGDDPAVGTVGQVVVEDDDGVHVRELVTQDGQFSQLFGVLGEDDPGAGVPDDVADVRCDGGGVDGDGRRAGTHRGVGCGDPFVTGGTRDSDTLARGDSQGDEPGCDLVGVGADL